MSIIANSFDSWGRTETSQILVSSATMKIFNLDSLSDWFRKVFKMRFIKAEDLLNDQYESYAVNLWLCSFSLWWGAAYCRLQLWNESNCNAKFIRSSFQIAKYGSCISICNCWKLRLKFSVGQPWNRWQIHSKIK